LNEAQAKAVRTCRRAALRIKRVVEEFLDLTRTGAER
jgi:hypothetical protein